MIPSVGRIVHYKLHASNAKQITADRQGATARGNAVAEGDIYPMVIVRLWTDNPDKDSVVQGQVFLDGPDTLWVTSVKQGDQPGQWHQPVHV